MNVFSAFDGMSCAQLALQRLGIKVESYLSSEVDKYAKRVTQRNFPNTIQLGDIRNIDGVDCDLIVGGSPCQGFSFAGKQKGFEDSRSQLFYEFVRVLKSSKPRYFLLENVKMSKESESVITDLLEVEPIEINSNLLTAQNRTRLYWSNIENISKPVQVNVTWGDVRQYDTTGMYYSYKAIKWLTRHSLRNNKLLRIHSNTDKMQMVEASHHKKYSSQRFFGIIDTKVSDKSWKVGEKPLTYKDGSLYIENTRFSQSFDEPLKLWGIRYITPIECERLQGIPDDYTKYVSDTQRYKMLGNGFTVDVIVHLLSGIIGGKKDE